jgi:glycosyltransferase involved in cell wall biosynthesis
LNIVYIITRLDSVGGAQTHLRDLAIFYAQEGHSVTVLGGGNGPLVTKLQKYGVNTVLLPSLVRAIRPIKDGIAVKQIASFLKKTKPDIVACHSSKAGLLGRIAAKIVGIPTVFTAHGWAFSEGVPRFKRQIYILIEKMAALLAQKIITVSEYDYNLAKKYDVGKTTQLVCVHNGVHDAQEMIPVRHTGKEVHICMVARFEHQKDHFLLMRTLSSIRELPWTVDFIGDGPLQHEMEEKSEQLGIADRVTFWGYQSDVAFYLNKAHIFTLISNWEGFPCSILEAMRAGLPIIASDVGGVSESIQDGKNGFLIPRGDVTLLRNRLQLLINDPVLRKKMGTNSRKKYMQSFTFEKMAEKTLAVYHEAIQSRQ